MPLTLDEVRAALAQGALDRLVGELESDWLEVKRTLYRLDTERDRLEVVKDISGMANAAGGVILLGYATNKDEAHGHERLSAVTRVRLADFNADQIRRLVDAWTFPPKVQLEFISGLDAARPGEGVIGIFVSAAEAGDRPILVTKSAVDDTVTTNLVGLFERKHADIHAIDPQRLHARLQAGIGYEDRIATELQALQALLTARLAELDEVRRAQAGQQPRYAHLPNEERERRVQELVQAVGFEESAQFILVGTPETALDLTGIFSTRQDQLGRHIENPPALRDAGFDLNIGERSGILHGDRRRAVFRRWGALEAHRDGTVIFVAPGGESRLCWGRIQPGPRINPIAMGEMTYLFCRLLSLLYTGSLAEGQRVRLQILMRRLDATGAMTRLSAGVVANLFAAVRTSDAANLEMTAEMPFTQNHFAEHLAYRGIAEIYRRFGFDDDAIPYTSNFGGERGVNPDEFTRPAGA